MLCLLTSRIWIIFISNLYFIKLDCLENNWYNQGCSGHSSSANRTTKIKVAIAVAGHIMAVVRRLPAGYSQWACKISVESMVMKLSWCIWTLSPHLRCDLMVMSHQRFRWCLTSDSHDVSPAYITAVTWACCVSFMFKNPWCLSSPIYRDIQAPRTGHLPAFDRWQANIHSGLQSG